MGLGHCALRNSSAEAKVCASNPDAHSNRPKARLKLSSSSTIPMMHLLAGVFGSCTAPYYRKLPVTRHCTYGQFGGRGSRAPTHFELRASSRRSISAARRRLGRGWCRRVCRAARPPRSAGGHSRGRIRPGRFHRGCRSIGGDVLVGI